MFCNPRNLRKLPKTLTPNGVMGSKKLRLFFDSLLSVFAALGKESTLERVNLEMRRLGYNFGYPEIKRSVEFLQGEGLVAKT
jgi:hypothetical protein